MVNSAPRDRETEQSTGLTNEKLADGEVTGDEVGTNVFPILFHTYRCHQFARRIIRANSSTSMVARQWRAVVDSSSLATACPSECGYNISRS